MPAAATSSVAVEVQPLTSVRTMAKVSSTRPAVTLRAPATSKWRSPATARVLSGMKRIAPTAPRMPTGTSMKRIHSQPSSSVSTPPSSTPVDPPTAPIAPQ